MIGTYLVHGWRHLLVVLLTHGLWTSILVLLEAHIDLSDDYELLCYAWLMLLSPNVARGTFS